MLYSYITTSNKRSVYFERKRKVVSCNETYKYKVILHKGFTMRIDDITLKEAPVGMLKKAGQAAGARALGAIGMKGKAGNLAGKADLSDTANNLYNEFRRYLGTQDKDIKTATGEDLTAFLNTKGAKVPGIPTGVVNKNIINKAMMQAAKDAMAGKQGVKKIAPAAGAAPQAASPGQGGKPKQAKPNVPPKVPPAIMKQLKALNPQEKKQLASML